MAIKDLSVVLKNLDGSDLTEADEPVTVQKIITSALVAQYPDEQGLSGDEKFARFNLAMQVSKDAKQDLSPENVVLIKKLVGKGWGPLIVGPVYEVLNG